jgi:hypothetical protein
MATQANGQIIHAPPALHQDPVQNIQNGALEAASAKTLAANAALAEASTKLGVGQKGARRRTKRRKLKGGSTNLNAHIADIPEAGTIKGVSHAQNHVNLVNIKNQAAFNAVGDKDLNAPPIQLGGKGKKRSRKAKKHGRNSNRTHRRRNSKSSHRGGRRRRTVV